MPDAKTQVKAPGPGTPRGGLECRRCGCRDLRVDHTTRANGRIIRYRHCRHCGARMMTSERAIGNQPSA